MRRKRIISIGIDTGLYGDFLTEVLRLGQARQSSYVCLANVHMVIEAHMGKTFADIVTGADIVTPDGMPLTKALKFLYGLDQERVEGMRLLPDLVAAAEKEGLSVYFYGTTVEVLEGILRRVALEHPQLKIAGAHSPPFRELAALEQEEDVVRINASGAQIVFVSLGCPKQEVWMARNKGKIKAVMVGAGGAFPVYAGFLERAPLWMQKRSLEWFFRLCQEPKRLWKRYLVTNSKFLLLAGKEWLKKK
jgi:N-acetylglucosaminyldiphosphoundecaprenol N-acetyl-beta-D-mannosaminyltransferase